MATTVNKNFQLQRILTFFIPIFFLVHVSLKLHNCGNCGNRWTASGLAEPGGERLSLEFHKSPVPGEFQVNIINNHKPDNQIISLQTKRNTPRKKQTIEMG